MDEWLHAYDMCSKYFDRLDPEDIVIFIDEITFSSKAVIKVSKYIWRIVLSLKLIVPHACLAPGLSILNGMLHREVLWANAYDF